MKDKQPNVSICIPTYNAEKTVAKTLDSLLAQTYPAYEIIISDNCSTDATWEIISEYVKQGKVKAVRNEINIGGGENFTKCMHLATGDYTAIFHADDIYSVDMLKEQVQILQAHPDVGAVFTGATLINSEDHTIGSIKLNFLKEELNIFNFIEIYKLILKHYNFLVCPSVLARTTIYQQEIKRWRGELFGSSVDLDVWLRIAERHKIAIIKKPLMSHRISTTQWSHSSDRITTEQAAFFKVIENYANQPGVTSALTRTDERNLEDLLLVDKVKRAANFFIQNDMQSISPLTKSVFKFNILSKAFRSKKRIKVILFSAFLSIAKISLFKPAGKYFLLSLKRG